MSTTAQYHCDKCGMEFPSIAALEVHSWTKHRVRRNDYAEAASWPMGVG